MLVLQVAIFKDHFHLLPTAVRHLDHDADVLPHVVPLLAQHLADVYHHIEFLGADWVKTSTGYGTGGATIEDLKLMRQHSPAHVQVKAAGGVRTLDKLLEVRALGVTRVGASRTADILDECRRRLG